MENKQEHYTKISKQIGVSYFFNFLLLIFQPLLIGLLTRVLSIKDFGIYSLLFTTISLLTVFFRFGLVEYIRNKVPGLKEEERVKTIMTLLVFVILLLGSMGVLLFILNEFITRLLGIGDYPHLWLLCVPIILCLSLHDLINTYLQAIKKIFIQSFLSFFINCFWVMVLFIFLFFRVNISLGLIFIIWFSGIIFSLLLVIYFIRHEIYFFIKNSLKLDFVKLSKALKFSLPLVMMTTFNYIIMSSDRYFINYYLGKPEVAIYSLAYGIVTAIAFVPSIFQNVIHPYFAEKWNLKEDPSLFFNIMIKYSLMGVFPAIVGLFVLRNEIITLLSGPAYLAAAPVLIVLLLFPLFNTFIDIFNKTLFLRDMTRHSLVMYFFAAVISITLNFFLVPLMGILGAACSAVISYFILLVILFNFRPRNIKFNFGYVKISRILLASLVMGLIIAPINPASWWSKLLVILFGVVVYLLLLFVFRTFSKEEKELIKSFYINLRKS